MSGHEGRDRRVTGSIIIVDDVQKGRWWARAPNGQHELGLAASGPAMTPLGNAVYEGEAYTGTSQIL